MNLEGIDLNLLLVFDAVIENESITKAAAHLGMGRSTASKALSRLRALVHDDLFYETEDRRLKPTRVAQDLHTAVSEPVKRIVAHLTAKEFDPSATKRTFHIAAGDYFSIAVLPALVERVRMLAPGVSISIFPAQRPDVIERLDLGKLDFALGWFAKLPTRFTRRIILTDEEALVARPGHRLLGGTPSLLDVLAHLQIVVDLGGDDEASPDGFEHENRVLRRLWISRFLVDSTIGEDGTIQRAAVTVPYFNAVAPIVAKTDMIAVLPRRLAEIEATTGKVVILKPPYDPLRVGLQAIYATALENDQGLKWLFDQIDAVTATLDA